MKPILFTFGPVIIFSYGFFYLLGLFLGIFVTRRLLRKGGLAGARVDWVIGVSLAVGLIMMRFLHFWIYRRGPIQSLYQDILLKGGMYFGALLGGGVTLFILSWLIIHRVGIVLDSVFTGIAAGHALGRVGCFMAGCCWGRPTHLPWGVVYTNPMAHETAGTPLFVRVHPVQLYEALLEGLLAILLWRYAGRGGLGTGRVFAGYLVGYGSIRFVLEFLRGVPKRAVYGPIDVNHLIAAGFVGIGVGIWGWHLWKRRKASPSSKRT